MPAAKKKKTTKPKTKKTAKTTTKKRVKKEVAASQEFIYDSNVGKTDSLFVDAPKEGPGPAITPLQMQNQETLIQPAENVKKSLWKKIISFFKI